MTEERETTKVQEELSDELDKKLLEAVRDGVEAATKDGVVRIPAPAAFLECARKRLHDLGLDKVVNADDSAAELQRLLKDAPDNVLDLPPISDEPEFGQDPHAKSAGA